MALNLWQCVTAVICVWGMFEIVMPSPAMTSGSRQKRQDANKTADDNDGESIEGCEEGGSFLRETQSCYKYINDSKDYFTARLFCKSLGGNLAMPKTLKQNRFVTKIRTANNGSKPDIWIGMNDLMEPNTLVWDDNEQSTYSRWAKDETNQQTGVARKCGRMTKGAYWTGKPCKYPTNFVCQVPRNNSSANIDELKPCPTGWTLDNGICYKLAAEALNYYDSRKVCEFQDALIAMPKNEEQHNFLVRKFGTKIWLGVNDIDEEEFWVFEDGRPVSYFQKWRNNEPPHQENGIRDCVTLNDDANWVDEVCFRHRQLVCQKPAQDVGGSGQDAPFGA